MMRYKSNMHMVYNEGNGLCEIVGRNKKYAGSRYLD